MLSLLCMYFSVSSYLPSLFSIVAAMVRKVGSLLASETRISPVTPLGCTWVHHQFVNGVANSFAGALWVLHASEPLGDAASL